MTNSPATDFLLRLRQIDECEVTPREVIMLWAIQRKPGFMGRELAVELGYKGRSNIQHGIRRLLEKGFIADRRKVISCRTPNDLIITSAGASFLARITPN